MFPFVLDQEFAIPFQNCSPQSVILGVYPVLHGILFLELFVLEELLYLVKTTRSLPLAAQV